MNRSPLPPEPSANQSRITAIDSLTLNKPRPTPTRGNPETLALDLLADAQDLRLTTGVLQARLLRGMKEIGAVESASLYLLDDREPGLCRRLNLAVDELGLVEKYVPLESGAVWECLQERAVTTGLRPSHSRAAETVTCLPLLADGQILGAVELACSVHQPGGPAEMRLLKLTAAALANSLYARRTLAQLNQRNEELEASRAEILNSRNILRAVFDNMPASIYIIDRDYLVIAVNKSRADRAELKPNEVVGQNCFAALQKRETPCPGCKIAETFVAGAGTLRQACDEQAREWEISTFPVIKAEGPFPERVIVMEQDITEKHLLEANLIHSEKLATIGQLAAGVAHEINNPLAAIIANAQLLERSLDDDDSDNREMLSLISTAGDRASRVVRNLLDIARADRKSGDTHDLNSIIIEIVSLVQYKYRANGINLGLDLSQEMPPIAMRKDHIEGVLINLIMNAIDAVEGGARQEVRVQSTFQDGAFHITVIDNGRGITEQDLAHIFEPFYTTKGPGRGTGLGLSICQKIIKEYNGSISVETAPGQGSSFHVIVPHQDAPPAE